MKRFIQTIILMLINLNIGLCQEYPKLEVDSLGNKFITFTYEQAQRIDNSLELLFYTLELKAETSIYDSITINLLNEKNELIISYRDNINRLNRLLELKDDKINNLNKLNDNNLSIIADYDKLVENKDLEIELKDKKIRRLKGGIIIMGVAKVALISLIIYSIL
jgi:hypothetical protein